MSKESPKQALAGAFLGLSIVAGLLVGPIMLIAGLVHQGKVKKFVKEGHYVDAKVTYMYEQKTSRRNTSYYIDFWFKTEEKGGHEEEDHYVSYPVYDALYPGDWTGAYYYFKGDKLKVMLELETVKEHQSPMQKPKVGGIVTGIGILLSAIGIWLTRLVNRLEAE